MNRATPFHAYPALMLAGSLAIGVTAADAVPGITSITWAALVPACLCLAVSSRFATRRRIVSLYPIARTVLAGLAMVGLGASLFAHSMMPGGVPVDREGTFEIRVVSGSGDRLITRVNRFDGHPVNGLLQVVLPPGVRQYGPGDELAVSGTARAFAARRNPGEFDYRRYMALRGVHTRLFVDDSSQVRRTGFRASAWERVVIATRRFMSARIAHAIPDEESRMLVTTLVVGDRTELDPETRDAFVRTGLMHLLAVSGLHVLIVGMILYALLRSLLLRLRLSWWAMEWSRTVLVLMILSLYAAVTGAPSSVTRSVVMAGVFMLAGPLQRPSHPMNALGAAALFILLVQPGQLFDVGFQLSFSAVAALIAIYPTLRSLLPRSWLKNRPVRLALEMFCLSAAATLGTAPVLAYHFAQVPLAGLLLNIVGVPLSQAVLSAGLLTLMPDFLGGTVFGSVADLLARWLLLVAEKGDTWLSWSLVTGRPGSAWFMALLATMPFLVAMCTLRRPAIVLGSMCLSLAAGGVWSNVAGGVYRPGMQAVFFDVGQGDAVFLSFPDGKRYLVDTGARDSFGDRGSRVIVPFLRATGIRRLDAVILTHAHSDHTGGLPAILRNVEVEEILSAEPLPGQLLREITRYNVQVRRSCTGLRSGYIQYLSPSCGKLADNVNDRSAVLRVGYGNTRFLLMGDAGMEVERELPSGLLRADVVKVGHHGSPGSSSPEFVRAVVEPGKTRAVVSAGRVQNRRFTQSGVRERWVSAGARVSVTAEQGAVWLRSDGRQVRQVDWR